MRYLLIVLLIISLCSCGTGDLPTKSSGSFGDVNLAPANPDQKVYICPSTMEYHLSGCRFLTKDKEVALRGYADANGYVACRWCFPDTAIDRIVYVYVLKDSKYYHLSGCLDLNKTKTAIPKADAIAQGYKPCLKCTVIELIHNALVYVVPDPQPADDGKYVYHTNIDCKHLDGYTIQEKAELATTIWKVCSDPERNFRECLDCYETRHNKE